MGAAGSVHGGRRARGCLFVYARQRHGTPRSAVALAVGSLVGLMIGLGWALRGWALHEATPDFSRELLFEWNVIAFFELGRSAVVPALGLLMGWLSLECHGWFRRRSATQNKPDLMTIPT